MTRDSGEESQRTVAELLAQHGSSGGADNSRRRRRRAPEDETGSQRMGDTAPQAIIDRVNADSKIDNRPVRRPQDSGQMPRPGAEDTRRRPPVGHEGPPGPLPGPPGTRMNAPVPPPGDPRSGPPPAGLTRPGMPPGPPQQSQQLPAPPQQSQPMPAPPQQSQPMRKPGGANGQPPGSGFYGHPDGPPPGSGFFPPPEMPPPGERSGFAPQPDLPPGERSGFLPNEGPPGGGTGYFPPPEPPQRQRKRPPRGRGGPPPKEEYTEQFPAISQLPSRDDLGPVDAPGLAPNDPPAGLAGWRKRKKQAVAAEETVVGAAPVAPPGHGDPEGTGYFTDAPYPGYDEPQFDDAAEFDAARADDGYDLADQADLADRADQVDDYDDYDETEDASPARQWLMMAGQLALGVVGGAAVWLAFNWLWGKFPAPALIAAVIVTAGLVWIVRKIRRAEDLQTTVLAVLVGLVVTVSPAALLLVSR